MNVQYFVGHIREGYRLDVVSSQVSTYISVPLTCVLSCSASRHLHHLHGQISSVQDKLYRQEWSLCLQYLAHEPQPFCACDHESRQAIFQSGASSTLHLLRWSQHIFT